MKHGPWNQDEVRGGGAADGDWDDFFKDKAAQFRNHLEDVPVRRFTLLDYLGMNRDEYADWFLTGNVANRVKRIWSPPSMRGLYS